jgi:hypothetical protein
VPAGILLAALHLQQVIRTGCIMAGCDSIWLISLVRILLLVVEILWYYIDGGKRCVCFVISFLNTELKVDAVPKLLLLCSRR